MNHANAPLPSGHSLTSLPTDGEELRATMYGQAFFTGAVWVLLASLLVQLIYGFYFLTEFPEADSRHYGFTAAQSSCLFIAAAVVLYAHKFNDLSRGLWSLAALFTSGFWCLTAFNIDLNWQQQPSAEKVILFGFFTLLIGWFFSLRLLAIGLGPLIVCYLWLSVEYADRHTLDLLISLLKFPVLVAAFTYTLRKLFLLSVARRLEGIELNRKLFSLSRTDELTGIANRKGFNEALEQALAAARRFSKPLTLAIIDVDHFKKYNDLLGHPAGDACLQQLAQVIGGQMKRATDTFARIGGEEFALILPGTSSEQAVALVEAVLGAVDKAAIAHPGSPVADRVTLSVGLASYDGDDLQSLYRKADEALYQVKQRSRNGYLLSQA